MNTSPQRLLVEATEANFEDAAYLRANPDVAQAVTAGTCPSPRAHFDAFGRHEQRALRLPVDPSLKTAKLARVRPLLADGVVQSETPTLIDCLPYATRVELHLDPTENVSSHEYDEHALAIIERHRDGIVLDCGAGLRNTYYPNVVNYEIVDYDSTDVLGAAERLPFKDESFDAVLSLNVLEHVKDPFQAAREIMRVMKPGAELMCVAPFLQPLHGYPHHYYNMTAKGLENLFEPLRCKRTEIYGAMHPIWALNWLISRYWAGLPIEDRIIFESMTVAQLMGSPRSLETSAIATELAQAARSELASAHALIAQKPDHRVDLHKTDHGLPLAHLIADPTLATLQGCSLIYDSDETYERTCGINFWDDPMDVRYRRPNLGKTVSLKRFILELDDSWTLDGHRFFVNRESGFIADKVISDLEKDRILLTDKDTGLSYDQNNKTFHYRHGGKRVVNLPGRIGVAVSVEPSNWGSFLTRIVPKAIALRELNCSKILVWHNHPNQLELIRMAGWKDDQIIRFNPALSYSMDTAVLPSEWTNSLYLSPTSRSLLEGLVKPTISPQRNVYISRRMGTAATSKRICLNAEDVEKAMSSLGLEIITPDQLTVQEQIDLFASARLVVGSSGAGLFNTIFCTPGTRVIDIESQPNWIWGHSNLFSSKDLNFGIALARPESTTGSPHAPFTIDVHALVSRVKEAL